MAPPNDYSTADFNLRSYVSGFANNAYLLRCPRTDQSVIIDAPDQPSELIQAARQTTPQRLLITHGHWDHIQGINTLLEGLDRHLPVAIGAADAVELKTVPHKTLTHNQKITFGELQLAALATPGHTPGSFCFHLEHGGHSLLFSGDTLFPGGPGLTKSAQAFKTLLASLEEVLFKLPDDTVVLPGHGASTVLKQCKQEYLVFKRDSLSGSEYGEIRWLG